MTGYVETTKGRIELTEYDHIVVHLPEGDIQIILGDDPGKKGSLRISGTGEKMPSLVVTPDGGVNSIRLRLKRFDG